MEDELAYFNYRFKGLSSSNNREEFQGVKVEVIKMVSLEILSEENNEIQDILVLSEGEFVISF